MTNFDKLLILALIFGTSLLSSGFTYNSSKRFTCEQLRYPYINGECVKTNSKETK